MYVLDDDDDDMEDELDVDSASDHGRESPVPPLVPSSDTAGKRPPESSEHPVTASKPARPATSTAPPTLTAMSQPAPHDLSTKSHSKDIKAKSDLNGGNMPSLPCAYRPGRLTNTEILERIFPFQKRTVLELVLQGCNGDLVKAIEHFLSAQDTMVAQQQIAMQHAGMPAARSESHQNGFHPYMTTFSPFRHPLNGTNNNTKIPLGGGIKSAFTPLSPTSSYPGLHSAFSPRSAAFTTDALLSRAPSGVLPHHTRAGDILAAPPGHFAYPGLNMHGATMASFGPSIFMNPYRPFGLDALSPGSKMDKSKNSDSPRSNDSWDESPNKDKDSE